MSCAALTAACRGEQADRARDPTAWANIGGNGLASGSGGGGGASAGHGGTTGGAGLGGAGTGGSAAMGGSVGTGGSAGTGGSVATGGSVGTGGGAGTGAGGASGGTGGTGGKGGAGGRPTGPGANGSTCTTGADCMTGYCFDNTCCATDCSQKCRSCANTTGTCTLAAMGTDPRTDCAAQPKSSCGSMGSCNGSGSCSLWPASTVCDPTPACDSTKSSVIPNHICNGGGTCVPNSAQSCNGFVCAAGACATTCADDSACVSGGFCAFDSTCVADPNLAGNGDLETNTLTGWSTIQGGGALSLSSPAASGFSHGGQYSVEQASRSANYSGPSYAMPTGIGQYVISVWGMQNQDAESDCLVQARIQCKSNTYYGTIQAGNGFGLTLPSGVWTQFNATVDFNNIVPQPLGTDCFPPAGLIRSAYVFLNQVNTDSPTPYVNPALYMDDLVIQVTDGHNLIGNPTFEAGLVDGWTTSAGASSLGVSATVAHGGTQSLWQKSRTVPTTGIRYALPIGLARYAVSLYALQAGTMQHTLMLQPAYSCIETGSTLYTPTSTATVAAAANTWVQLSGTFMFPAADAPPGCHLSSAAVYVVQAESGTCAAVECPDLFVDDASITLK